MLQGRKSRTAIALGCTLALLAAGAAVSPAFASAQAAVEEYELGELPDPDGDDKGGQSQGGGGAVPPSSGSGAPPTAGAPGSDPSSSGGGSQGGDKSKGGGKNDAKEAKQASASGATKTEVPVATSDPSDDGGVPVLLILLALVAAGCTGVAIWRLRKKPDEPGHIGRPGTGKTTAETQSL